MKYICCLIFLTDWLLFHIHNQTHTYTHTSAETHIDTHKLVFRYLSWTCISKHQGRNARRTSWPWGNILSYGGITIKIFSPWYRSLVSERAFNLSAGRRRINIELTFLCNPPLFCTDAIATVQYFYDLIRLLFGFFRFLRRKALLCCVLTFWFKGTPHLHHTIIPMYKPWLMS